MTDRPQQKKSATSPKRQNKRSPAPWYETAFAQDYVERYQHRSDDAASAEAPLILKSLELPARALVLDVCCGAGRHSRALAAAGVSVLAFDLSLDLLKCACKQEHLNIAYLRADMRRIPIRSACMDGAISIFTSFGYFESDSENLQVLKEVARVLKPGARFVLDYFNLQPTLDKLVPKSEKQVGALLIKERRRFDIARRRLIKTIHTLDSNGNTCAAALTESLRAYSPLELSALFRRAGLKIVTRFGDLQGSVFNSRSSPRCVVVATRV